MKAGFIAVLGAAIQLGGAVLLCVAPSRAVWQNDSPLPVSYVQTKTVAAGDFLYKIGGRGDKGICGAADVLVAPLNPDGSAGSWTPTTSLPSVGTSTVSATCGGVQYTMSDIVIGWGYEAVYANGFIYILGGNLWNFNGYPDGQRIHFSSAVYYAATNADGSLGPWRQGASLSTASFDGAGAAYNGTLYLTGGRDDAVTTNVRRDVYYAHLNPDGSPSAWQTASDQMPGGLWLHGAQAAAGRLYISGGVTYDPFPRDQITDAVYSAPLASDGTPGAWREEASLPLGLAGQGMRERHGILYTLGGQEPTFPTVSVHEAAINPDGTLVPWTSGDPLPVALYLHGSASSGDSLYVDGGSDGNLGQKAVYHLPDAVPPAAVTDLSASAPDASSLHLQWTAPGNDGSFGSVSAGSYRLSAATDPGALVSSTPTVWTASFDPGAPQSWRLPGLAPGTTYYVSLSAVDSAGNVAAPSNVAAAQTYFLASSTEAPPVVRLQSPTPGLTISAVSGAQSATLTASAPGAAVTAFYEIQPAANLAPGLLTVLFSSGALNAGLALYEYQSGIGWSSAAVAAQTVDAASDALSGRLAQTGIVGIFGPYPVPTLAGLSPAQVVAGSTALVLTVNGGGFAASSVVQWNGVPRPTTFVSSAQLTASLSADDVAVAELGLVTVFTPAPGGGTSAPAVLTISNPAPSLTALSPNTANAGGPAFSLTVTGAGFVNGSAVQWNGSARSTTFVSPTQLTAAISAADIASAGAVAVSVVTPAPGGGASAPVFVTVANPAPSVAALSPNTATAGGAAFSLSVTGAGFVNGSTVQWNGASRATTFVSSTQLNAAIAAADIASAAAVAVTVVTPAPGGGVSGAATFNVVPAAGGGGWPDPGVSAEWSPRTLNLDSQGREVHLRLEVESWGRSRDIVASSVRLTAVDGRPVSLLPAGSSVLGDDDSNGVEDDNIVFDRALVAALLTPGDHSFTVTGLLGDGRGFVAEAHLRANAPAGRGARAAAALRSAGPALRPRFWPAPSNLLALRTMAWDATTSTAPASSGAVNGRIAARIPEGAPAPSVVLTISTTAPAAAADRRTRERVTTDSGLVEISSPVAFGPEGTHFVLPITLELPYDRAQLPAGMDESALAVNYWNPSTSNWERLPSTVDRQAQIVRAQTTHFSLYQVLGGRAALSTLPVAAPDASFGLHAAYAFPNPVRGAGSVTIRIQPGSVDGAEVRIYDLSGRKIHSSDAFTVNPALDDGNGLGPQITYDHVWNVSGVGSGVYTYVVRARKSGQADVVKTGKIGVIK
ncbi:MAG: fibronectin type III domain-containing protein [Elusimicrobia bacterium]|nr:fibronectin type III domain-containing protein [Elusimicrobiota bacterium]